MQNLRNIFFLHEKSCFCKYLNFYFQPKKEKESFFFLEKPILKTHFLKLFDGKLIWQSLHPWHPETFLKGISKTSFFVMSKIVFHAYSLLKYFDVLMFLQNATTFKYFFDQIIFSDLQIFLSGLRSSKLANSFDSYWNVIFKKKKVENDSCNLMRWYTNITTCKTPLASLSILTNFTLFNLFKWRFKM